MIKVLGLGNALVDIMTKLDDDNFLEAQKLPKGSMQLVDIDLSGKILEATKDLKQSLASGGSAANTIHGLGVMGANTGYIGTVGNDKYGEFFKNDMQANNTETKLFTSNTETGRAIALISPDTERTFATYLGAAVELSPDNMTDDLFTGYTYMHTEGYLVFNNDLILKALQVAKKNSCKVSLDLASYNVVEANLGFLKELVNEYVDIVFANEEEAKSFTGKEPEEALHEIAKMCEIAVVKIGEKGSMIKKGDQVYKVDAIKASPVDTTGAGDLYASGFLYGLTKGMSLDKCGKLGSILSGNVIEVIGSKMPESTWKEIKEITDKI